MSDGTAITVEEVAAWLRDFAAVMAQEKDALTALDQASLRDMPVGQASDWSFPSRRS